MVDEKKGRGDDKMKSGKEREGGERFKRTVLCATLITVLLEQRYN